MGRALPLSLRGDQVVVPSIESLESFRFQTDARYPEDRQAQLDAITAINEHASATNGYGSVVANQGLSAIRSADQIQAAAAISISPVGYH